MNENANSQNTETTESNEGTKQVRPTRKQFGFARKVAAAAGVEIPAAAVYNPKSMGASIAAHAPAAS